MPPFHIHSSVIPKILTSIGILILLTGAIIYIAFQARLLIAGPKITLMQELPVIQNQRHIILEGIATNITAIYLNDRPIVTNEVGEFKESLILENGYTIATIRAQNRYGREVSIERTFVYDTSS